MNSSWDTKLIHATGSYVLPQNLLPFFRQICFLSIRSLIDRLQGGIRSTLRANPNTFRLFINGIQNLFHPTPRGHSHSIWNNAQFLDSSYPANKRLQPTCFSVFPTSLETTGRLSSGIPAQKTFPWLQRQNPSTSRESCVVNRPYSNRYHDSTLGLPNHAGHPSSCGVSLPSCSPHLISNPGGSPSSVSSAWYFPLVPTIRWLPSWAGTWLGLGPS